MKAAFPEWRSKLDAICKAVYLIDTGDMGFDRDELLRFWKEGESPLELADWLGSKYDLTRAQEVGL